MSTIATLENFLTRLPVTKGGMSWRGVWNTNTQYYLYDTVLSGVDGEAYILEGKTAILNGGDPSTNPDWTKLSAGQPLPPNIVESVSAGVGGIAVGGTSTNPIISWQNTDFETGTITSAAAGGANALGFAGSITSVTLGNNNYYLFGTTLLITGPCAGGSANFELNIGSGDGVNFPFTLPALGVGANFQLNITGIFNNTIPGAYNPNGTLTLPAAATSATFSQTAITKLF